MKMTKNQKAFLDMIAFSEGTSTIKSSDNGYNVLVGGGVFSSYTDHPRKLIDLHNGLKSTAAGRYQLLARYFDIYKQMLGLHDFSPAAQDAIALEQISECHALHDIEVGNLESAIRKCAHIWASLPGAGYGQRENKLADLQESYLTAGGTMA